ncbi:MAG: hypothetical protein V3V56_02950, partial [bacterium]
MEVLQYFISAFFGIFIYVVTRFFVEATLRLNGVITDISEELIFYADMYSNPGPTDLNPKGPTKYQEEAINALRRNSSRLAASANAVWFYPFFEKIHLIPPRTNVQEAQGLLMRLSHSIFQSNHRENEKEV